MKRRYVQTARAEAAAQTRRDILDAARAALLGDDGLDVSVGEIAAGAGVARSTVYTAFGSRAGLLAALANEVLHGAGLGAVLAAYRDPDPARALEDSLLASCRMYAADRDAFARLLVLAQVDPEAAGPVERSNRDRRTGMDDLAGRLAAAGRLGSGVDAARAAQVLTVATGFWAFDELFTGRGLEADGCAAVLVGMVCGSVLAGTNRGGSRP